MRSHVVNSGLGGIVLEHDTPNLQVDHTLSPIESQCNQLPFLLLFAAYLRLIQLHLGEVVLQQFVNELVASANSLEQQTLSCVVEETGIVPRNVAVAVKDEA